jgi:multidrug efflux pump subunit AcrA (membrane-fusion protein)
MSRSLVAGGMLALAGAALWFWLRPTQVSVAEVYMREISPAIQGVGTVESKVVVQLAAKIPGRIVAINVDQGDAVRRGQALIQLENSESNAEVDRAVANLERSKLGVTAQRAALLRAQAALSAAEAAVARARANRSLAHANAERWRKLATTGDVSQMDLDSRLTAAQSADEELKSAEAQREAAAKEVAAQEAAAALAAYSYLTDHNSPQKQRSSEGGKQNAFPRA